MTTTIETTQPPKCVGPHLCHHCGDDLDCKRQPETCDRDMCESCIDWVENNGGVGIHEYERYDDDDAGGR